MDILDAAALREKAAKPPEVVTTKVECPELGGAVLVRGFPGPVRNQFEGALAMLQQGSDGSVFDPVMVSIASACIVDERGNPVLTRVMAEKLWKNYPSVVFRVRDAAIERSAMAAEDVEAFKKAFD